MRVEIKVFVCYHLRDIQYGVMKLALAIIFLLLSSGSFLAAAVFDKKYEAFLPLSFMLVMAVQFVFGVAGLLQAGFYASLALCIACYPAGIIYAVKKKRVRALLKNFFSAGFAFFALLFAFLIYANYGRQAYYHDELAHWMDIVKVMTQLNDFGTNPLSHSIFAHYPPALSLMEYFAQKVYLLLTPGGEFCEWLVYLIYQGFFYSLLFPFLGHISIKKPVSALVYAGAMFFVPVFFQNVHIWLAADAVLAMLSGTGMAAILLVRKKDWVYSLHVLMICCSLVLVKDAGMFFALFLALAYALDRSRRGNVKRSLLHWGLAAAAAVLPELLWKMEVALSGVTGQFMQGRSIADSLRGILSGGYELDVVAKYAQAFYDQGIVLRGGKILVNFFALALTFLTAIFLIYKLISLKDAKQGRSAKIACAAIGLQLPVYIGGLLVTYLTKFDPNEAVQMASFDRYISIAYLALAMCIVLALLDCVERFARHQDVFAVVLLYIIIMVSPLNEAVRVITRREAGISKQWRSPYEKLADEIEKHTQAGDKACLLSLSKGSYAYLATMFNARPVSLVNPNHAPEIWALGEEGAIRYTAEEWREILVSGDYDYAVVYKFNDYFLENYPPLFENPDEIRENSVYRVNKTTGTLTLCE